MVGIIDADETRERWLALRPPNVLAALRERCKAAAVVERDVEFSWWAYHPRPFARQMAGEEPARRSMRARLAVDAVGRPVIQRERDEVVELYSWTGERCEIVSGHGGSKELVHCAFVDGLLVEEVATHGMSRLDGQPAVSVMRWSYDRTRRPSRVIETYESGEHHSWGGPDHGPYWKAKAYTFVYDEAGELATITVPNGATELAAGAGADAAQEAAAAGFPALFEAPHVLFDGRTQAVEHDLPDPARAYEGMGEPLADAIFAAVALRRDALGPLEFVLVAAPGFVSKAVAADATFVDRARSMGLGIGEMLDVAWREPTGTVVVDAIDTAPAELLKRLRAARQALASHDGPSTAIDDLGRALALALNAREWPGAAPTFLALSVPPLREGGLHSIERFDDDLDDFAFDEDDELEDGDLVGMTAEELAAALGDHLDALDPALTQEQQSQAAGDFMESLAMAARHSGSPRQPPAPGVPSALAHMQDLVGSDRLAAFAARVHAEVSAAAVPEDLRPDCRDELARLLEGAGLTPDEAALVAGDAQWGILLELGGTGVSRLGGRPVLPAGTPWPTAGGRPLAHLATIAMDELPDVEGREHLPADGVLSFFADVSEEGEFFEPVEPADICGRDLFAVIHTPAGCAADEPPPPGGKLVERRVRPTSRLQIRHLHWELGNTLFGLDALAEDAVLELAERVNGSTHHQLLGFPWPVQEDPRQPGQIVLFHIADDPTIDFHFLDAGDLHFLGTPGDIKGQRWEQLTIWPSSC